MEALSNSTTESPRNGFGWLEYINLLASSNSSNLTITPPEDAPLTQKQLIMAVIFGSLALVTTLANAFVLYIFFVGKKRLRTPTNLLLANLAVADLLVGVIVMPMLACATILEGKWLFGNFGCEAFDYVHFLLCGASMWSMIGVWVDRYIGVSRPLQYKFIVTQKRTYYLIIFIWASAVIVTSGPLAYWQKPSSGIPYVCWSNLIKHFLLFVAFLAYWIPISVTVAICWTVYKKALAPFRKNPMQKSEELEKAKSKQVKLTKTIAIVTLTLFIFYMPVFACFTMKAFDSPYFSMDLLILAAWIRYFCSTVDPFMYGLAVPGYRQEIKERLSISRISRTSGSAI